MARNQDIRWIQRFSNFNKAMAQLKSREEQQEL